MLTKNIQNAGFTLLEVILAIFVALVGIGGVFALLQTTIFSAVNPTNQLVAAYLAQEGVEIARNIRDTNYLVIAGGGGGSWDTGLNVCADGCEADYNDTALVMAQVPLQFLEIVTDANGTHYQYGSGIPTFFTRKIILAAVGPDQYDITVEVSWQEKGKTQNFIVDSELYNWAGL